MAKDKKKDVLLKIQDLRIEAYADEKWFEIVHGVDLTPRLSPEQAAQPEEDMQNADMCALPNFDFTYETVAIKYLWRMTRKF